MLTFIFQRYIFPLIYFIHISDQITLIQKKKNVIIVIFAKIFIAINVLKLILKQKICFFVNNHVQKYDKLLNMQIFFCHCIIKPTIRTETQRNKNIKNFHLHTISECKTVFLYYSKCNFPTQKHCHNTIKQYKILKL